MGLAVVATSQPKGRSYEPGCHQKEGYYHIPGGSRDFFPKDTWLLLMECKVLRSAEVVKAGMAGTLRAVDTLRG